VLTNANVVQRNHSFEQKVVVLGHVQFVGEEILTCKSHCSIGLGVCSLAYICHHWADGVGIYVHLFYVG